jgi:hypothetical protein
MRLLGLRTTHFVTLVIPVKPKRARALGRSTGIQSHKNSTSLPLWIPAQRPNALSLCAAARQPCATHSVLAGMTKLRCALKADNHQTGLRHAC